MKTLASFLLIALIFPLNLKSQTDSDSIFYYQPDELQQVYYTGYITNAAIFYDFSDKNITITKLEIGLPPVEEKFSNHFYIHADNNHSIGKQLDSIEYEIAPSDSFQWHSINFSNLSISHGKFWISQGSLLSAYVDTTENTHNKIYSFNEDTWYTSYSFAVKLFYTIDPENSVNTNHSTCYTKAIIYPTPFNSKTYFNITFPEANNFGQIFIYDLAGRIIDQFALSGSQREYSIQWQPPQNMASGIYYFSLKTDQNIIKKKFIFIK